MLLLLFLRGVFANSLLPTVLGTAQQGQTLTAAPGSWVNGIDPVNYAYQWQRNGVNVAGATTTMYPLTAADVGRTIRVVVTATDSAGTVASATSASTATVVMLPVIVPLPGYPQIKVEIDFIAGPAALPVNWVDVTNRVRSGTVTRPGRQHELGRVETGVASLTLENRDRALDPTNAAGPYWPNVRPMRRLRIQTIWNGVVYDIFQGFIERWPPRRNGPADAEVQIDAVDGLARMQAVELDAFYGETLSGNRVNLVLDEIGWPTAERAIDTGESRVADEDLAGSNTSGLEHLLSVGEAENGAFFADARGRAVFHDRHRRLKEPYITSQGVFGSGTGELPYVDLEPSYDVDEIWNDVRISVPGDPDPAVATDQASIDEYGRRTLSLSMALTSWDEALDAARWLLSKFKDPLLRYETMKLKPNAAMWPQVFGREFGDRITVVDRPAGGGAPSTVDCSIEGATHEFSALKWSTTWRLSPADQNRYWIVEHPLYGRIDSTNRIAY